MASYEWKCSRGHRTEVWLPMSLSHQPPDRCSQSGCSSLSFTKLVSLPQRLARDSGRETSQWPLVAHHLKTPTGQLDASGRPTFNTPVFLSQGDMDRYLKAKGLVRYQDGQDSSIGPSQHSVYDRYDPPPSEDAVTMMNGAKIMDADEVEGSLNTDGIDLTSMDSSLSTPVPSEAAL